MLPQDIVNRALDALPGPTTPIGSFSDGSDVSEAARRIFDPTLRQLLRTANWDWARKRGPLFLLADATAQTPGVGVQVEFPWTYMYAWPNDAVRIRWLPWSGLPLAAGIPAVNIQQASPSIPQVANLNITTGLYIYERPARFLISSTDQYPAQGGVLDWSQLPNLNASEGTGAINRRIILTNVQQAQAVYTFLAMEIELWDALFQQAMVSILASMLATKVIADAKIAIAERNAHIALAKNAIREARVASSQEQGFPQSTDHTPDWIRVRSAGRGRWNFPWGDGGGPGIFYCGWDGFGFCDGSVF